MGAMLPPSVDELNVLVPTETLTTEQRDVIRDEFRRTYDPNVPVELTPGTIGDRLVQLGAIPVVSGSGVPIGFDLPSTSGPTIIRRDSWVPEELTAKIKLASEFAPKTRVGAIVKECLHYLPPELAAELVSRITSCVVIETQIRVLIRRTPWSEHRVGLSLIEDHGITSRKAITDTGVAFLVDAFRNLAEIELFNFHGIGTSSTAENPNQTGLIAEATTQYNPDNVRATGTQSEPAGNQYRSVGVNTVDASITVEEHGLFSDVDRGEGTMWDRSLTGTQTLSASDGIQVQHTTTVNAGG